ncbi:phosphotransferase system, enzyme I, PtsI [Ruminococcaceae bacterium YRB3002]|nr:phosphotransferase system, enzyme I, PtsI [Ruminococcaceae bacterium YRB3002]
MIKYTGKGVYGAVAIGVVSVFKRQNTNVERIRITDPEAEKARFVEAKEKATEQLQAVYEKALAEVGEEEAAIFEVHMMMIEDEDYNDAINDMIESDLVNAEFAVASARDSFAAQFSAMDDSYFQARAADIKDISDRILNCLADNSISNDITGEKMVVCSDDLAPSETVSLDKSKVLAFATAYGSSNSHTAILARNMNIPAVIGLGREFLDAIADGQQICVDGYTGEVYINPDEDTVSRLTKKRDEDIAQKSRLKELIGKDNITIDGTKINVFCNIGGPKDIPLVNENDGGGIGLFRSEFLYLENSDFPSEQQQFEAYKNVLESMKGKKVIIRTLDIGADKKVDYFNLDDEENPAMGIRAIRICLTRPEIFKTQLRALYRASVYGNLGIMFPMITSESEISEIMGFCDIVKAELDAQSIPFSRDVELGIMIETPAAAVISDKLAPMVDFFSVGTNDLTQYTLACDRQNPKIERFVDTHHEAVLRLIEMAAKAAHDNGKWIGICGELGADTSLTERFLKMGIDELSVSPPSVLKVRDKVRSIDLS